MYHGHHLNGVKYEWTLQQTHKVHNEKPPLPLQRPEAGGLRLEA